MKKDHGTIPWQGFKISYAGITDRGRKRKSNEDDFLLLPQEALFCVADGAGGHESGVLASYLTLTNIASVMSRDLDLADITLPVNTSPALSPKPLFVSAIEFANLKVFQSSANHNMASTIVGCHFMKDFINICHVGDSRAYLIRDGVLSQLTEDHSFVFELFKSGNIRKEEMRTHPKRNIITKAIGPSQGVQVSHQSVPTRNGDMYLLCSDGLNSMLDDATIFSIVKKNNSSLIKIAEELVKEANIVGGKDNITVVLINLFDPDSVEASAI